MRKVGVSALAAAASFALGWGLLRSITARGAPGTSEELLTRMAADLILIAGALVAGWYFLTALGACLAGGLRLLGAAPRQLERFLGRFGAPMLRKVATWSTVSVIAFGSPALAAPGPPPPGTDAPADSPASEETTSRNSAALVDLGWGAPPADPGGVATRESTSGSRATDPVDETPREHVVKWGDSETRPAANSASRRPTPLPPSRPSRAKRSLRIGRSGTRPTGRPSEPTRTLSCPV